MAANSSAKCQRQAGRNMDTFNVSNVFLITRLLTTGTEPVLGGARYRGEGSGRGGEGRGGLRGLFPR